MEDRVMDYEQSLIDLGPNIERERDALLESLSIDFFVEAISEGDNSELSECVIAFKQGDTLRLGNLIRDMIDEYAVKVSEARWMPRPSQSGFPVFVYDRDGNFVGGAEDGAQLMRLRHANAGRLTTVRVTVKRYREKFPEAA
jgi:hypothetical protein